jgi:hypothetical protein
MKNKFDKMAEQKLLEIVVDPFQPLPWWIAAALGMVLALILLNKWIPALLLMVVVFRIRQDQKTSALSELIKRVDRTKSKSISF